MILLIIFLNKIFLLKIFGEKTFNYQYGLFTSFSFKKNENSIFQFFFYYLTSFFFQL